MKRLLTTLLLSTFTCAFAQTPNDFDQDGLSDITFTSGSLVWKVHSSSNSEELLSATFGRSADLPVVARWQSTDLPSIAVVRRSGSTLNWRVRNDDNTLKVETFGKGTDLVVSGGDFDGNGYADAVTVRAGSKSRTWSLWLNPFAPQSAKKKTVQFGSMPAIRAFFLNPTGARDVLAFSTKQGKAHTQIETYDIVRKKKRVYRNFPAFLSRDPAPRPFRIQNPEGKDVIGVAVGDETDTSISVYGLNGRLINKKVLTGLGQIITGDYDGDIPGWEIMLQSSDGNLVYNPFVNSAPEMLSSVSGTLVAEGKIGVVTEVAQ